MRYYFIAGERSGDLHASNLIKQLLLQDARAEVRGMGGELMQACGAVIFKTYNEVSFMGFLEVFLNFRTIARVMHAVKADIVHYQPDVLVLVDFSGFNLRVAAFAKKNNIKVYYYISPKIWAWNQKRAWKVKALVDRMFVILPFEKKFYSQYDYPVDFVGNPVNDAVQDFLEAGHNSPKHHNRIALLPGSRLQEVQQMLSILDGLPAMFPKYEFVVAAVSNISEEIYKSYSTKNKVEYILDQSYEILYSSFAAIVTSGTATLETALLMVPQVVVYKTSKISYHLAKWFLKVKYISLVNLIAGEKVVEELIQDRFTLKEVAKNIESLIVDNDLRAQQLKNYQRIKAVLGEKRASTTTAELMINYLQADNLSSI